MFIHRFLFVAGLALSPMDILVNLYILIRNMGYSEAERWKSEIKNIFKVFEDETDVKTFNVAYKAKPVRLLLKCTDKAAPAIFTGVAGAALLFWDKVSW